MKISKIVISLSLVICLILLGFIPRSHAQLEESIEELTSENTKGYLQPFVDSFGHNMNAGIYRTAHVSAIGLDLYVGLVSMATIIPEEDKTYMATPPDPYSQEPVETATVFGDEGAVVSGPGGMNYPFPDGQLQGDVVPFVAPHIEVGSILGTMAKFRYFSGDIVGASGENLGDIQLVGYGLQHSISQYLFMFPMDLSAGIFYQQFDVGDIISSDAISIGVQASRSFALLTVYGAAAFENASMDVSYTFQGGDTPREISLALESETQFRLTAGARLGLGFLILNGDFTVGKQNTASLGVGIGL